MTQCLAYTLAVGLALGLAVGQVGGLVAGNGTMWFRYAIGTTQAARRGVAPHRLASFLDWGLDVGVHLSS